MRTRLIATALLLTGCNSGPAGYFWFGALGNSGYTLEHNCGPKRDVSKDAEHFDWCMRAAPDTVRQHGWIADHDVRGQ